MNEQAFIVGPRLVAQHASFILCYQATNVSAHVRADNASRYLRAVVHLAEDEMNPICASTDFTIATPFLSRNCAKLYDGVGHNSLAFEK